MSIFTEYLIIKEHNLESYLAFFLASNLGSAFYKKAIFFVQDYLCTYFLSDLKERILLKDKAQYRDTTIMRCFAKLDNESTDRKYQFYKRFIMRSFPLLGSLLCIIMLITPILSVAFSSLDYFKKPHAFILLIPFFTVFTPYFFILLNILRIWFFYKVTIIVMNYGEFDQSKNSINIDDYQKKYENKVIINLSNIVDNLEKFKSSKHSLNQD